MICSWDRTTRTSLTNASLLRNRKPQKGNIQSRRKKSINKTYKAIVWCRASVSPPDWTNISNRRSLLAPRAAYCSNMSSGTSNLPEDRFGSHTRRNFPCQRSRSASSTSPKASMRDRLASCNVVSTQHCKYPTALRFPCIQEITSEAHDIHCRKQSSPKHARETRFPAPELLSEASDEVGVTVVDELVPWFATRQSG